MLLEMTGTHDPIMTVPSTAGPTSEVPIGRDEAESTEVSNGTLKYASFGQTIPSSGLNVYVYVYS